VGPAPARAGKGLLATVQPNPRTIGIAVAVVAALAAVAWALLR
jgi:hypothetical protein